LKYLIFGLFCIVRSLSFADDDCKTENLEKEFKFLKELTPKCFSEEGYEWTNPEETMAKIMKDVTPEEVVTRLIFAESLASNCSFEKLDKVSESIAWTIHNRNWAKSNAYGIGLKNIVFKNSQFRSSFADYDVAKRKEFLCPTGNNNFKKLWGLAYDSFEKTILKPESNPMKPVRNYFFPNHFKDSKNPKIQKWHGTFPKWANEKTLYTSPNFSPNKECILLYNLH